MSKLIFGIVVAVLLSALLAGFFGIALRIFIRKIKAYSALIYQKDIDLQKAIIETQEQTLANISQNLHDDAGQQLTALNFQLENLKLDVPELREKIEPVSESVAQLSGALRQMSHDLSQYALAQHDLPALIHNQIARLKKSGMDVRVSVPGHAGRRFPETEKTFIYRIFQEALNNVIKHAQSQTCEIHVVFEPKFRMSIADSGRGFDGSEPAKITLGMHNMARRAAMIRYDFNVASQTGKGTTITLTEP